MKVLAQTRVRILHLSVALLLGSSGCGTKKACHTKANYVPSPDEILASVWQATFAIEEEKAEKVVLQTRAEFEKHCQISRLAGTARLLLRKHAHQLDSGSNWIAVSGNELSQIWDECVQKAWPAGEVWLVNNHDKEGIRVLMLLADCPVGISIFLDEKVGLERPKNSPPPEIVTKKWALAACRT